VAASREGADFGDNGTRRSGHAAEHGLPLIKRLDRIVAFVESGQGSVGKLLYDPTLYKPPELDRK